MYYTFNRHLILTAGIRRNRIFQYNLNRHICGFHYKHLVGSYDSVIHSVVLHLE